MDFPCISWFVCFRYCVFARLQRINQRVRKAASNLKMEELQTLSKGGNGKDLLSL